MMQQLERERLCQQKKYFTCVRVCANNVRMIS